MLLRFKIKNFLSFYEETVFDMFPNPKRERFNNHIYTTSPVPLLKQAAIYGENGAGKSNFIKAIDFLYHIIYQEDFLKNISWKDYVFLLVEKNNNPISFTIEIYNKKVYIYEIEISDKLVERLWISGVGKKENELVFERNGSKLLYPITQNTATGDLLAKNPKSSVFPLNKTYPILERNVAIKNFTDWFSLKLEILRVNYEAPRLIKLLSRHSKLFEFTKEILAKIGIVESITIKETLWEEWLLDKSNGDLKKIIAKSLPNNSFDIFASINNTNVFNILKRRDGQQFIQELVFTQNGINGFKKEMPFNLQSYGTQRMLTLIPAIYYAMKEGKVVFIDEIENSIHPNLIYSLLHYYSTHKTNGQLIFSTHLTKFLNQQELVRLDEVWNIAKKEGNSYMYSFNEYNIHNTINIENGYLDGRYGYTPSKYLNI